MDSTMLKLYILLVSISLANSAEYINRDNIPHDKKVYTGIMIRLASVHGDCWLDLKTKRWPKEYEDGRRSTQQFMSACIPKQYKPNKAFHTYDETHEYEPDGPYFFLKTKGKDFYTADDLKAVESESKIQMYMDKIETCLLTVDVGSSVSSNLMEVSGFGHIEIGILKEDCDWEVNTGDQNTWTRGKVVQFQHLSTEGILGLSGKSLPASLRGAEDWKEVVSFFPEDINKQTINNTLWVVDDIRFRDDIELSEMEGHDNLYGVGTKDLAESAKLNNTALSVEDLYILQGREKLLIEKILKHITPEKLDELLGPDGYSLKNIEETNIKHPIDNYNLLKRTARTWRKIKDTVDSEQVKELIENIDGHLPQWDNCRVFAPLGLLLLQYYHDTDPKEMVAGTITFEGKVYQAATKLRKEDVRLIGKLARQEKLLTSEILWYETMPELKKYLKEAIEYHNEFILNPETAFFDEVITFKDTYEYSIENNFLEKFNKAKQSFQEGLRNGKSCLGSSKIIEDDIIANCKKQAPAMSGPDYICEYIHFNDPYIKLGAFKLEKHSTDPVVAQIHDFMYEEEMTQVKDDTKGDMRSTPYIVKDKQEEYSAKRTSKIKYLSERTHQLIGRISQRLDLGLGFNIYNPNYSFSSENYQVMNYGIGGHISIHADNPGLPALINNIGGGRMTTSMIYLSDVEAGGRTIFPHQNVSIDPRAGNLLYWTIVSNKFEMTYRMIHMGCPVVYGNKWIANKWVNWREQMNRFPCHLDHQHFPHHHHYIDYSKTEFAKQILRA